MSPPNNRPARRPRGRVVVVGEPLNLSDMTRPVVNAANLFDAVGEITVSGAADPVAAVVVPARMVGDSVAVTVEAFRRVDPEVRLILVASSEDEQRRISGGPNGFDVVLVQPVTAGSLAEALDETQDLTPRRDERAWSETAVPMIDVMATVPPAEPTEELGDTDLVEAILLDPEGLRDRGMRLICQQTTWSDLTLTDDRPADERAGCAEVRFGRRCYGILSSRRATAAQLRPWAQWLARWMALDQGYRDYRTLSFRDELTGAWNRRFYDVFMRQILRKAARTRRAVTVLVFDIDDFKRYNDQYGHAAGDEVLKETVRLLNSVIRGGDRVCRIGGDEFVVIFADLEEPRKPGSNPPETVEEIATRFQDQISQMKFPKLGLDAPGNLSISGGLATYPWDAADAEGLLAHADQLSLQSKRTGKNAITIGPGSR